MQSRLDLIDKLVKQGLQYHRTGQEEKAKGLYLKVIAIDPQNFDSLYLLGMIEAANNKGLEAIHYLSAAAKVNKQHPEVRFNLGVIYEKTEQSLLAIELYKQTIFIKPDFYEAYFNLANIFLNKKSLMML